MEWGIVPFIKFRCRLPRRNRPDADCGRMLGGPRLDTVLTHDYLKGPFEDMRYCDKHGFIRITIRNPKEIITQEQVISDGIDMVSAESVFGAIYHKTNMEPVKNAG